ncbi:DUF6193 family natural product biosynthesis protein [Streptomyces sp. NPDC058623]|uniref:DUF6193 family natural product biosynthesis protein n=1 Tax=Streptomyces sp. NPDC058623 TaxID=3346563 RepID=UPI003652EB54
MTLIDGTTDDLAAVAEAASAWHDGVELGDLRRATPFVHLTGRFEVPDLDPAGLVASAWQHLRTEARELEYAWRPLYQALIEAAHAEPALRRLHPFTSHWSLRFSTRTRPRPRPVGASLVVDTPPVRYSVAEGFPNEGDPVFPTPAEAVSAAVRRLPPNLPPGRTRLLTRAPPPSATVLVPQVFGGDRPPFPACCPHARHDEVVRHHPRLPGSAGFGRVLRAGHRPPTASAIRCRFRGAGR